MINTIVQLRRKLKMPATFQEYGLDSELFESTKDEISEAALKDRTTSANPRVPVAADVKSILEDSFS